MDAWFKAKAESLAQAAQEAKHRATELQQSASQLTQGALEGALQRTGVLHNSSSLGGTKELRFGPGPLGFRLEGTLVVAVEDGRQAASLGLEVGDRLVAVDGYVVPAFQDGDLEGEARAKRLIKKWMKEMPRPATLSFEALTAPEPEAEEAEEDATGLEPAFDALADLELKEEDLLLAEQALEVEEDRPEEPPPETFAVGGEDDVEEAGELEEPQEMAPDEAEAEEVQPVAEQPAEPSTDPPPPPPPPPPVPAAAASPAAAGEEQRPAAGKLQEMQQSLEQARKALEAEQQKSAAQQKKLNELQKREKVLGDEVSRLGASLQQTMSANTEALQAKAAAAEQQLSELREKEAKQGQEIDELRTRSEAAEARAALAEQELAVLRPQLEKFTQVHEAELELLRSEHEEDTVRRERSHQEGLSALKNQAAVDLEQARSAKIEAQLEAERCRALSEDAAVEAEAAAVEARAARQAQAEAQQALEEALEAAAAAKENVLDISVEEAADDVESAVASPPQAGAEEAVLREHIAALEARCGRLQRRLADKGGAAAPAVLEPPDWEPRLAATLGPVVARVLALLCGMVEQKLRGFTNRLLRHSLWLHVFYAHLLVLYAVSASCYAQSGIYAAAPLDAISISTAPEGGQNAG